MTSLRSVIRVDDAVLSDIETELRAGKSVEGIVRGLRGRLSNTSRQIVRNHLCTNLPNQCSG